MSLTGTNGSTNAYISIYIYFCGETIYVCKTCIISMRKLNTCLQCKLCISADCSGFGGGDTRLQGERQSVLHCVRSVVACWNVFFLVKKYLNPMSALSSSLFCSSQNFDECVPTSVYFPCCSPKTHGVGQSWIISTSFLFILTVLETNNVPA